jgi:hypothetical protein
MKIGYMDHQELDEVLVTAEFDAWSVVAKGGFEWELEDIEVEVIKTDPPLSPQVIKLLIDKIRDDDFVLDCLWDEAVWASRDCFEDRDWRIDR